LHDVQADLSLPLDLHIVTFDNEVILFQGCLLNQFNKDFTYIKSPKEEELRNANSITLRDMPCVAFHCLPAAIFLVPDNIYNSLPVNDLKVNNICGRIIMRKSYSCAEVFQPMYSKCIIVTQKQVIGTFKCISHLYGNIRHAERTNVIHFRAFRNHKEFQKITSNVLNPDVLSESKIYVSMFSAHCNIGLHVGVNDHSMLQWQMSLKYRDKVYFFPRTDEQTNIFFFRFKNINDILPQYSPKNIVTCSITRRGIMNIKITCNDTKMCLDKNLYEEFISMAKNIRLIVQLLV